MNLTVKLFDSSFSVTRQHHVIYYIIKNIKPAVAQLIQITGYIKSQRVTKNNDFLRQIKKTSQFFFILRPCLDQVYCLLLY